MSTKRWAGDPRFMAMRRLLREPGTNRIVLGDDAPVWGKTSHKTMKLSAEFFQRGNELFLGELTASRTTDEVQGTLKYLETCAVLALDNDDSRWKEIFGG